MSEEKQSDSEDVPEKGEKEEKTNAGVKANLEAGRDAMGVVQGPISVTNTGGLISIGGCNGAQGELGNKKKTCWKTFWRWDPEKNDIPVCLDFKKRFWIYATSRFVMQFLMFGALTICYLKLNHCRPGPVRTSVIVSLWAINLAVLIIRIVFHVKEYRQIATEYEGYQQIQMGTLQRTSEKSSDPDDVDLRIKANKEVENMTKQELFVSLFVEVINLVAFASLMGYKDKKCISETKQHFQLGAVIGSSVLTVCYVVYEALKYYTCKKNIKNIGSKFYLAAVVEMIFLAALLSCAALAIQTLKREVVRDRIVAAVRDHYQHGTSLDVFHGIFLPVTSSGAINLKVDELYADTHSRLYGVKRSNVLFDKLLKTEEKNPCIHTILEGEPFSGRAVLCRRMCYEFAANPKSVYHKRFDIVLEYSMINISNERSLKEHILYKLQELAGEGYESVDIKQLAYALKQERILFLITDVTTQQSKTLVEEFIAELSSSFPESKSVLFLNPFETIHTKLSCLYKISGVDPNSHTVIINMLSNSKCRNIITDIMSEAKRLYNEEFYIGHVTMMALGCRKYLTNVVNSREVLNSYVDSARKSCNADADTFMKVIKFGFRDCLKGNRCRITRQVLEGLAQAQESAFDINQCILFTKVQRKGGELLFRYRKSLLLYSIIKLKNEEAALYKKPQPMKADIALLINREESQPIRAFISEDGPTVCMYGTLAGILFCLENSKPLQEGQFFTEGEVDYIYKSETLGSAQFPLAGKAKWILTSKNNMCRPSEKTNIDPKCAKILKTSKTSVVKDEEEFQYFMSTMKCEQLCSRQEFVVYKTEEQSKSEYVHSRYSYQLGKPCLGTTALQPAKLLKMFMDAASQTKNVFYTMEWKDTDVDVPSFMVHATYHKDEEENFKAFTCQIDTTGAYTIESICSELNQKVVSLTCENVLNNIVRLSQKELFTPVEGIVISDIECPV